MLRAPDLEEAHKRSTAVVLAILAIGVVFLGCDPLFDGRDRALCRTDLVRL